MPGALNPSQVYSDFPSFFRRKFLARRANRLRLPHTIRTERVWAKASPRTGDGFVFNHVWEI